MIKLIVLVFGIITAFSCSYSRNDAKSELDDTSAFAMSDSMKTLKSAINRKDTNGLILYRPENLSIDFVRKRPDTSDSTIFLSIPAAYTTPCNSIDGVCIDNGVEINYNINENVPGGFGLFQDKCRFYRFDAKNKDTVVLEIAQNKGDFFQQRLLILNNQLFPCSIPSCLKLTQRRSICQIGQEIFIAESKGNLSIDGFSKKLAEIGVTNAIYSDMGGWSEGWYRSANNRIQRIGNTRTQTHRQTNWLIFKRAVNQ